MPCGQKIGYTPIVNVATSRQYAEFARTAVHVLHVYNVATVYLVLYYDVGEERCSRTTFDATIAGLLLDAYSIYMYSGYFI